MSKEEKKNVDIDGLSSFMLWAFILLGVVVIGGQLLFKWSGTESILFPTLILIPGCIVIVIWAQKYDHNK